MKMCFFLCEQRNETIDTLKMSRPNKNYEKER